MLIQVLPQRASAITSFASQALSTSHVLPSRCCVAFSRRAFPTARLRDHVLCLASALYEPCLALLVLHGLLPKGLLYFGYGFNLDRMLQYMHQRLFPLVFLVRVHPERFIPTSSESISQLLEVCLTRVLPIAYQGLKSGLTEVSSSYRGATDIIPMCVADRGVLPFTLTKYDRGLAKVSQRSPRGVLTRSYQDLTDAPY